MKTRQNVTKAGGNIASFSEKQQKVLDVLRKSYSPLTAYKLLSELKEEGFRAPLQVYRALKILTAHGAVHRLESLNAFIACRQSCGGGKTEQAVLFAICDLCGNAAEETHLPLTDALELFSKQINFKTRYAVIELRGRCGNCNGGN